MGIGRRVGTLCLVLLSWKATADEMRVFAVWHDGKPAGTARMRLASGDGATECSFDVRVDERTAVGSYRYTLTSREVWRDGRAVVLRSSAEEDGTAYELSFNAASGEVQAKGTPRSVVGPVWPTTFALLPSAGPVALLDADSGRVTLGRLEKIRTEMVRSAETEVPATKYHVSGGRNVTLWYDAGGRLVRQSWLVAGTEMVMELVECTNR